MFKVLSELLFGEGFSRIVDSIEKYYKKTAFFNNKLYKKWIKTTVFNNITDEEEAKKIFNLFLYYWKDFEALNEAIKCNTDSDSFEIRDYQFTKYIYNTLITSFDYTSDIEEALLRNFWYLLKKTFFEIMPEEIKSQVTANDIKLLSKELNILQRNFDKLEKRIQTKDNFKVFDDFEKYLSLFNRNLFLDKKSTIKLSDIYIKPHCVRYLSNSNEKIDLFKYVCGFISQDQYVFDYEDKYRVLFIFGKPGIGKSSFVSYVAANKSLFKHDVYFIRLRDMEPNYILQMAPLDGILEYLGSPKSNLKMTTLILDGLDEISAIYNKSFIKYIKELIQSCDKNDIYLIITTRDGYFDYQSELQRFTYRVDMSLWSRSDMERWKSIYVKEHPELSETIISNIKTLEKKESLKKIFAVPILFYMANAKDVEIKKHQNVNSLYDEIFEDIFDERKHDPSLQNNLDELIGKKLARQIAKEIAFSMHITGQLIYNNEQDPCIGPEKVSDALEKAFKFCENTKGNSKKLTIKDKQRISELYALSFYYEKSTSDFSAVEFAHKTIAEYFIADKIVELLFKINNKNYNNINNILFDCFCCKPVTPIIFEFIREKIIKRKDSKEYNSLKKNLSDYFITSCVNGNIFFGNDCEYYSGTNVLNIIPSVFKSTLKVLFDLNFSAWDVDLNNEQIRSFGIIVDDIAKLEEPSEEYKIHIPFYLNAFDFSNCFFSESNFEETEFAEAILPLCEFNNCYMSSSNFSGANLDNTTFEDCELSNCYFNLGQYNETKFISCILNSAVFNDSILKKVIFEDCNFQDTDFERCVFDNVHFINSVFSNAILDKADLSTSNIEGTVWDDYEKPITNLSLTKNQYEYLESQGVKLITPNII